MKTNDDFHEIVNEYMGPIQLVYDRFSDKRPVLEIELPRGLLRAFPYLEYFKTLSARSQKILKRDYAQAAAERQIVVFVRDNQTRTLKSCRLAIEAIDYSEVHGAWVKEPDAPPKRGRARQRAVRRPPRASGGR